MSTILVGFSFTKKMEHTGGAYHLVKKSGNFGVKSNGTVIFPENPFGNGRLPPEVVPFFRSERNSGNFLTIC